MTFRPWISASIYFIIRGIGLLMVGLAQMLWYSILLFGWACAQGVMLFHRLITMARRPRQA